MASSASRSLLDFELILANRIGVAPDVGNGPHRKRRVAVQKRTSADSARSSGQKSKIRKGKSVGEVGDLVKKHHGLGKLSVIKDTLALKVKEAADAIRADTRDKKLTNKRSPAKHGAILEATVRVRVDHNATADKAAAHLRSLELMLSARRATRHWHTNIIVVPVGVYKRREKSQGGMPEAGIWMILSRLSDMLQLVVVKREG